MARPTPCAPQRDEPRGDVAVGREPQGQLEDDAARDVRQRYRAEEQPAGRADHQGEVAGDRLRVERGVAGVEGTLEQRSKSGEPSVPGTSPRTA